MMTMNHRQTDTRRPNAARRTLRAPATAPKRFPKRRNNTGVFFVLVFVLLMAYSIGFFVQRAGRPAVSLMRVEMGSILQPTGFSGLIIRDEAVYTAPAAGSLVFHAQNHERVRAGSVIASVQDSAAIEALRPQLAQVDQSALDAQRLRGDLAMNQPEVARRNQNIVAHVNNAVFELSSGNLDGVFVLGDRIRLGLESRNELYFSGEPAMVELSAARAQVMGSLAHAMTEVIVSQSGILSVLIDGMEGIAAVSNIPNISREIITGEASPPAISPAIINQNDNIFRIVRSNDWYIASYLPTEYVENSGLSEGAATTVFVRTPTGVLPLNVLVYRLSVSSSRQDEYFVTFRTNREVMRFIDARHIVFQLTASPQEGLKIPRNAIVERGRFPVPDDFVFVQDGVNVVLLRIGDNTRTEPVLGMRSADRTTFYILADATVLRVGDEIISSTESFTLGTIETVTGVFIANLGTTEFRFISLEDVFDENVDYVILNPAHNPNLRLFDRLVADARNVTDRQILH